LRAGTSIGANYREARRGRSKADFTTKIGICLQEADESLYWLDLLADSGIVRRALIADLRAEANELVAIFVTSARTDRRRKSDHNT